MEIDRKEANKATQPSLQDKPGQSKKGQTNRDGSPKKAKQTVAKSSISTGRKSPTAAAVVAPTRRTSAEKVSNKFNRRNKIKKQQLQQPTQQLQQDKDLPTNKELLADIQCEKKQQLLQVAASQGTKAAEQVQGPLDGWLQQHEDNKDKQEADTRKTPEEGGKWNRMIKLATSHHHQSHLHQSHRAVILILGW
jgi:hypothetical protein